MATIDDVAREAHVSKGTVSNVFSKKRPVSREVSERVLDAARRLDFRPNYLARTLATKKTHIIGLNMFAENMKFSYFHLSLINGVLRSCYHHGYRLLINTITANYNDHLEQMTSDPVDGEIILDPIADDPRLKRLTQRGIPVVVVGRPPSGIQKAVSFVDNDNVETAREVTTCLIGLGHQKILFLNNEQMRTVAEDRVRGYHQAFDDNGLHFDDSFIAYKDPAQTSVDFGYEMLRSYIQAGKAPTAVITDTDKMALGVYRAAAELGLRIPEDISVMAFSDDSVFGPELQPPLSGVRLNAETLGSEAVNMLIERMSDDTRQTKKVFVSSELVIRASCTNCGV
ncbi:LacI family DNA-binding transcriptional regulator [Alicyclobacillus curvatus]|nr:LacI family DNA-binding transcriptional regulator [Alicyclobacillus curvatus]